MAVAALAAGALWLAFTARHGSLVLSWSDEIVYAVMARNVAEGRGLITNFYDSRALLERGYPQGDVHMPGHPLFVSLFFRLLGPAEVVSFVPSWTAFLATGAIVGAFACGLYGPAAGLLAALLFLVMPGVAGYAHSCMAELTVVLASTLFLTAWWGCNTPRRAAAMALAICAAVLCRETLLAFLILAGEALWRAPRDRRRRMGAAFGAALAVGAMALVPLHLNRARFPHVLATLPSFGSLDWLRAVLARARANLDLPFPGVRIDDQFVWVQLALALGLPAVVLLSRAEQQKKRLAGAVLVLALAVLVGLVGFNPLHGWHMTRMLIFLAPWLAVLSSGLLAPRGPSAPRWLMAAAAVLTLGGLSLRAVGDLADDRRGMQAMNAEAARPFMRLTDGLPIETLVAWKQPWEIGWRRFPVTIVWFGPLDPATLRRINEIRRVDAIFGPRDAIFSQLVAAAEAESLGGPYRLVLRRPNTKYNLLLRSDLGVDGR